MVLPCLSPYRMKAPNRGSSDSRFVWWKMSGTTKRSSSGRQLFSRAEYAWAMYDVLPDLETNTYAHLKQALLSRLSPDTDEDWLSVREALSQRRLRQDRESIDELARDLKGLLDKASTKLPVQMRDTELRFHPSREGLLPAQATSQGGLPENSVEGKRTTTDLPPSRFDGSRVSDACDTDEGRFNTRSLVGEAWAKHSCDHAPPPSTYSGQFDVTHVIKYPRPSPPCIQPAIKNWQWEWPGNEAISYTHTHRLT